MTALDLAALRALAEKATPGPSCTGNDYDRYRVAANPAVVLALIERVERAEKP